MFLFKSSFFIYCLLFSKAIYSQSVFTGVWQGIVQLEGQALEKSTLIYAEFTEKGTNIEGKMRDEIYGSDLFAVKRLKGTQFKNTLTLKQSIIEKQKQDTKTNWCLLDATLNYSDSSGYLTGFFTSSDCKRYRGKIILYKSTANFSSTTSSPLSHTWFKHFINDYLNGYNAPLIRKIEREKFQFIPIYFETDRADLNANFIPFLSTMIRVVNGHSDLRIKITGHTDSDGSDNYNEILSKKRAETLLNYFINNGLSKDKIILDFKGEKLPVDVSNTPEGKQRNRRVDFSFI